MAFVADVGALALFVALGRRSHEKSGFAEFMDTMRPFLIALLVVWLAVFLWQALTMARTEEPADALAWRERAAARLVSVWPIGVIVWLVTAGGGLVIRGLSGGGLSGAFPYLTVAFLGIFMLGWRLVALVVRRRRSGT